MLLRATFLALSLAGCDALKVTVFGGSGFVGSRVCKALVANDVEVTSVSKSGRAPDWASSEAWANKVTWAQVDLLGAGDTAVDAVLGTWAVTGTPDAVVSCVGVVDPNPETLRSGNGAANVNAFGASVGGRKFRPVPRRRPGASAALLAIDATSPR